MNRITKSALLLAALLPLSCKDCGTDEGANNGIGKINPNILLLKSCCDDPFIGGNNKMGIWTENIIHFLVPVRRAKLGSRFNILEDTLIFLGRYQFISSDGRGRMLLVGSNYVNASSGSLSEVGTQDLVLHQLRDSTYNISSAIYLPSENRCIYYSYGNVSRQIIAGYYRLDLTTLQDSLLLQHAVEIGPGEVVNGFDVSTDASKLLFPINRRTIPPLIVEYSLSAGVRRNT